MKLISCTDFVLAKHHTTDHKEWQAIFNYANFLKQPLELGMFIPCVDGDPVEEPEYYHKWNEYTEANKESMNQSIRLKCEQYQQAKEKVLFGKGFEILHRGTYGVLQTEFEVDLIIDKYCDKTIEDLIGRDLTLTDNTIKQLGL